MRGVRAALAAVVSLAVAVVLPAAAAKPSLSSKTGRALIAYSSGGRIFTVRANGSHRAPLTGHSRGHRFDEDYGPAWSPDGSRIAFERDGGGIHIYVMRADGSHERPLAATEKSDDDYAPAWSPDGAHLAFIRQIERPHAYVFQVVISESDGSSPMIVHRVRLTDETPAEDVRIPGEVTFSPDGSELLLSEYKYIQPAGQVLFRRTLYSIPATGGSETLIAKHAYGPSFSPSGSRMAYVSEADKNGVECYEDCAFDGEIYVARPDGSDPRRLTHTKLDEESPDWSADGRRIVFSAERSPKGRKQLYSLQVHGQCVPQRLTRAKAGAYDPDWQPAPARSSNPGVCGIPVSGSR